MPENIPDDDSELWGECPTCDGAGTIPDLDHETTAWVLVCPDCEGQGGHQI